jgi:hypothetical protein
MACLIVEEAKFQKSRPKFILPWSDPTTCSPSTIVETWTYYVLARTSKSSLSGFGLVKNESYVKRSLALSHFTLKVVDPPGRIQ